MENRREPIEHAFNFKRLDLLFGVSSLIMLFIFVAAVYNDYTREWKRVQQRFNDLEIQRTQEGIAKADASVDPNAIAQFDLRVQAAQAMIDEQERALGELRTQLGQIDAKIYKADQAVRFTKALRDAEKYGVEMGEEAKSPKAPALEKKLESRQEKLAHLTLELEALQSERQSVQTEVDSFTGERDAALRQKAALFTERDRLERKLKVIGHNFANDWFRNRPIVDFMNPSIKVNQIVVDDLENDINYLTIPKVDRCTTCHLAIDQKGYEDAEQPFRTHPRLDVFLGASSPHPMDGYGCTICHMGRDRATTFVSAAHMPSDEEEAKRWEEEHDWEPMKFWNEPMLPMPYVEASCWQCHNGVVSVPKADHLNYGMHLIRTDGCTGCHKIAGFEEVPKAGPSLAGLAGKTTSDWAFKWIKNPKAFRPTTRMPRFFDLDNTSEPYDLERNNVEADAIVSYLFDVSKPAGLLPLPSGGPGDAANGKTLVAELGCRGCHLMDGEEPDPALHYRRFGPPLVALGSKTTAEWVWNWVKDPKRMMPTTRMPNLRLTDAEALDVTAYLIGLRNPEFDAAPLPATSDTLRDALAIEYLRVTLTDREARETAAAMSDAQKRNFLGEKLIARYGCFGCHEIAGFEGAKGIGTELTEEGSKTVHRFDFGFIEIPETRQAWIKQKLLSPRIYDRGRVKEPQEKLRMPEFGFTDEEADAITGAVLGLRKRNVARARWRVPRGDEPAAEKGWRIVENQNCRGCHEIDGEGGDLRKMAEDPGLAPPMLHGEGDRVHSDWLFAFLRKPTLIRPWLAARMPTFGFTDETTNDLVRYFQATAPKGGGYQEVPAESLTTASLAHGKRIFEEYRCILCHQLGGAGDRDPADLAPDLTLAAGRLRPGWILDWLEDPQTIMPNTRMPSYFYSDGERLMDDADAQIVALRNHLLSLGKRPAL